MSDHNQILIDYKSRINKVFFYIDQHLDSRITLDQIAEIAAFSPYHFHRIFRTITGETLNEYITRRRMEKSALDLIHKPWSLTEIFHRYGFTDSSTYSRTFKKFYGVSPTEFRKQNSNPHRKISQLESKNGQLIDDHEKYICAMNDLKNWIQMNGDITVKQMPAMNLAALTHIGVNGIENAFDGLLRWARAKHLLAHPEAKVGRMFYDSFKVTPPDKVRMSIFLKTDEGFEEEGEIHRVEVDQTKCIVGHFEITVADFEQAWSGLFIWMNERGYKKSESNPFEIYHNDHRQHPENKFVVDLCIPIE